jgi:hypothetical protein
MDFDENYCFGNVMSCTFYDKKFELKILGISSRNLALKWKLAEN